MSYGYWPWDCVVLPLRLSPEACVKTLVRLLRAVPSPKGDTALPVQAPGRGEARLGRGRGLARARRLG